MATVKISERDVTAADAFLANYLADRIPQADFSKGSVMRDYAVTAMAHIFAYLRAEIKRVRDYQSLSSLKNLESGEDVDQAVDAILSNLFITRRQGTPSRVAATLHFGEALDVTVQPTTLFYRNGLTFVLDSNAELFIPGATLQQVVLPDGTAEYTTTVLLRSATVGAATNVPPGRFSGSSLDSELTAGTFLYAENLDSGIGGSDAETTEDLLERVPSALSTRNLVNVKSVEAVLLEAFPELSSSLTVGFGEPEMLRDLSTEGVTRISMHTGGCMDVYVKLPVVSVTESFVVAGQTARADGVINIFDDALGLDFTLLNKPVVPGDVLKIHAGVSGAPREVLIVKVEGSRLYVSARNAFPEIRQNVTYSIGAMAPLYAEKVPLRNSGVTTNLISKTGSIYLPGRPRGNIALVRVSETGQTWTYLTRTNSLAPSITQYAIECLTPLVAQSRLSTDRLVMDPSYNGWVAEVTYDTLSGFETVHEFIIDEFTRNVCANNLARGYFPVYVSISGEYSARGSIDSGLLSTAWSNFVNSWNTRVPLDVSAALKFLRESFPAILRFYDPVELYYTLVAPDGQLYEFVTQDVLAVFPETDTAVQLVQSGLQLRDENVLGGLRYPGTNAYEPARVELRNLFASMGISNRNIRLIPAVNTNRLVAR